ncbi:aminotransferase class V-fold PLP-dependent enzyme [Bacillus shivajii]|uniref:aminotransferase class V-fold PLP-dependent enzyme n=1 Tax=Bacillus shivajii TaxID=1983719 RepID=UPI001CFBAEFE|nr:aminotransferase class V-fold PLP-dependent enzyme [Bacillus shivajii]UCZ52885.1 aminotransferase class V-fold PLP-dependent enzyme [Bacillus shivajii]
MSDVTINNFRKGMKVLDQCLYLDHGAMSPLHQRVLEGVQTFHEERAMFGNNFSKWWEEVDEVRGMVASTIKAKPKEIGFYWNTSSAINLIAHSLNLQEGDEVLITDEEFPSNVYPWMKLEEEKNIKRKIVQHIDGRADINQFKEAITEKTKVVSVSWVMASNGNKLDLEEIGTLCKENGIIFIVDAIQGYMTEPLDVNKIQADFVVSGFFKWAMGPDGLSFIYINEELLDQINIPFIGWASMKERFNYSDIKMDIDQSARSIETGNMNFSAIRGLRESLLLLDEYQTLIPERIKKLTSLLREGLMSVEHINMHSPTIDQKNWSGITSFSGIDPTTLTNHNIKINVRSGIRVSPHFYNTEEEIVHLLDIIKNG